MAEIISGKLVYQNTHLGVIHMQGQLSVISLLQGKKLEIDDELALLRDFPDFSKDLRV